MKRTGLLWVAVAAITVVISGCSKTEGTKPPSSEQPGGTPGRRRHGRGRCEREERRRLRA